MKLLVKLTTFEQEDFTAGNKTVGFEAPVNHFQTLNSVQQLKHCVEILDSMPPASICDGSNFTLEEVDDIITINYFSDVEISIIILLLIYTWETICFCYANIYIYH